MEVEKIPSRGRRWITVKKLPNEPGYGCFTEPALRHLIFNAQGRVNSKGEVIPGNGLSQAIIRVGRRVYIDLDRFDGWVDAHRCEEEV